MKTSTLCVRYMLFGGIVLGLSFYSSIYAAEGDLGEAGLKSEKADLIEDVPKNKTDNDMSDLEKLQQELMSVDIDLKDMEATAAGASASDDK